LPNVALRPSASVADGLLALLALSSAAAFFRAQESWLAGLLLLASLGFTLSDVGERTRRATERVAWALVTVVGAVGLGWTLYFLIQEEQIIQLRSVLGTPLVGLMTVFLMGRHVWRPERGLVPVSFAMLVLASVGPGARVTPVVTVAALAVVVWLLLDRSSTVGRGGASRVRWGSAIVYLSLTGALAGGIISVLPVAQPFVEQAARRFNSGRGGSGLSESGALGAVERLGLSTKIVLRMWSDSPALLRARVHSTFDGRAWTSPSGGTRQLEPAARAAPEGDNTGFEDDEAGLADADAEFDELPGTTFATGRTSAGASDATRILLARASRGWVVSPRNPLSVRLAGGTPIINAAGVLSAPFRPPPSIYGVTHGPATLTEIDARIRAEALQLPDQIDPRLVDLARSLSAGSDADAGRVDATVAWLGECCTYSLDVGAFTTDQPVVEFLFDKRRGYCEYFASAAALLLRLQGIPARYVTGLSVQPANRRGDHYLVRALDAHAWIEAWIEGVGWVEVDPTPAEQYAALRAGMGDGWARRVWEYVSGVAAEVMARVGTDPRAGVAWLGRELMRSVAGLVEAWRVGVGVLALLLAGIAGWRLVPRRRPDAADVRAEAPDPRVAPDLVALIERLESWWSELGHPRPSHRGHLEHVEALSHDSLPTEVLESSRAAVACYYEVRFGGRSPRPDEVTRLRMALHGPER
jgi:transglutaminase-like putative cysteine protease